MLTDYRKLKVLAKNSQEKSRIKVIFSNNAYWSLNLNVNQNYFFWEDCFLNEEIFNVETVFK